VAHSERNTRRLRARMPLRAAHMVPAMERARYHPTLASSKTSCGDAVYRPAARSRRRLNSSAVLHYLLPATTNANCTRFGLTRGMPISLALCRSRAHAQHRTRCLRPLRILPLLRAFDMCGAPRAEHHTAMHWFTSLLPTHPPHPTHTHPHYALTHAHTHTHTLVGSHLPYTFSLHTHYYTTPL